MQTIAREILRRRPHAKLALFEKESRVARHQSMRNSGVIHAGLYYRTDSLRAKLCVDGAKQMYDFVERHSIPHKRCGKVVAAVRPSELDRLNTLFERAVRNGCNVRRLSGAEVREIEPSISAALAGIHSPDTGVTDFSLVCDKLVRKKTGCCCRCCYCSS